MTGVRFMVIIPGLLVVAGIAMMVCVVLRMRRLRAAWRSGITAEGQCVGAYVVRITGMQNGPGVGPGNSTWHHVYEFITPDGQVRRFKEASGPVTVVP